MLWYRYRQVPGRQYRLPMGIWRLVMETNRLSRPSGCPLGVSQPFQILGRFPFWPLNLGATGKQWPTREAPALRVPSLPGGPHGFLWSGQTGAPRCASPRGSPPAIRFLGRSGAFWACFGAFWACFGHVPNAAYLWLGCRLRATV